MQVEQSKETVSFEEFEDAGNSAPTPCPSDLTGIPEDDDMIKDEDMASFSIEELMFLSGLQWNAKKFRYANCFLNWLIYNARVILSIDGAKSIKEEAGLADLDYVWEYEVGDDYDDRFDEFEDFDPTHSDQLKRIVVVLKDRLDDPTKWESLQMEYPHIADYEFDHWARIRKLHMQPDLGFKALDEIKNRGVCLECKEPLGEHQQKKRKLNQDNWQSSLIHRKCYEDLCLV